MKGWHHRKLVHETRPRVDHSPAGVIHAIPIYISLLARATGEEYFHSTAKQTTSTQHHHLQGGMLSTRGGCGHLVRKDIYEGVVFAT